MSCLHCNVRWPPQPFHNMRTLRSTCIDCSQSKPKGSCLRGGLTIQATWNNSYYTSVSGRSSLAATFGACRVSPPNSDTVSSSISSCPKGYFGPLTPREGLATTPAFDVNEVANLSPETLRLAMVVGRSFLIGTDGVFHVLTVTKTDAPGAPVVIQCIMI